MKDPKNEAASLINRAKEELEQALAHLDHIPAFDPGAVHFAAHALGNYLTISRLVTDLLLSALKEHPDPKIRTWLEGLHHATGLMNKTVKRLLDQSLSDAPPFVKDKVDMRIMIGRARDHYQNIARPKDISIMFMPPSEPANAWTDRVAVAVVLDNLLSNAVKFSGPGKEIRLEVIPAVDHVLCRVIDEGPGISPEDQARLFQRGVRLSNVPTAGEPSTGYGLAVAKEVIDQLGGDLWCESEPGKGSVFSFRLPVHQGE